VFVLKQKAGMGGYFVTDDMLHLLSSPIESSLPPRSPSGAGCVMYMYIYIYIYIYIHT